MQYRSANPAMRQVSPYSHTTEQMYIIPTGVVVYLLGGKHAIKQSSNFLSVALNLVLIETHKYRRSSDFAIIDRMELVGFEPTDRHVMSMML